jgi:AmmeMemoRadiSam system protein B
MARRSFFSGSWYPASAQSCQTEIEGFLEEGKTWKARIKKPFGGIVPHAGWVYSGSLACNVIHRFKADHPVDLVVIFGMHLHSSSPAYLMAPGDWQTPFGPLSIDATVTEALSRRESFRLESPESFPEDNTIELQLPFIKFFFPEAKIVAVGVPPNAHALRIGAASAEIAAGLGRCVRVLGSTDLTHYGQHYGFVPKGVGPGAADWVRGENDALVIERMQALDADGVLTVAAARQNACCAGAAAAAIAAAKHLGAQKAETLAYTTSYDKRPGDSFVGYVGMVF